MKTREFEGKLMFRVEGGFWVASFGKGPQDAITLGTIRMSIVADEVAKRAFIALMTGYLKALIEKHGELVLKIVEREAPESERAGRA